MVSSGVERRDRRTMGYAFADAVLRAQFVHAGAGVSFGITADALITMEAHLGFGPRLGRGVERERDAAMVPAEAAVGFAQDGEVEPGFGMGQQVGKFFEGRFRDGFSAHGCEAVADHEDHQRPEADHDAEQGRDVTQQPEGHAAGFHGLSIRRLEGRTV